MFSIRGTAIITGGASGIGKAIARRLAGAGASVWLFDRNASAAEEVARELADQGWAAGWQFCDVTDQTSVDAAVEGVLGTARTIDVLVNSAGIGHVGTLETTDDDDFDRLFQVNVAGTYHAMRAVVPTMRAQRNGVILNLASVAATVGLSDRFAYSMTKGAVVSMTFSVAKDYVMHGIRCNCISPGRVHTPFVDSLLQEKYPGQEAQMFDKLAKTQPLGRMATPDEIAALALYLCSDEAGFVTGSDYPIDGGMIRLSTV